MAKVKIKTKKSKSYSRELWAIIILIIGIFSFIAVAFPESTGWVGHVIVDLALKPAFGRMMWLFPILLLYIGGSFFFSSHSRKVIIFFATLFFTSILVGIELIHHTEAVHFQTSKATGFLGSIIAYSVTRLFGYKGSWIAIVGTFWISAYVVFNLSILSLFKGIGEWFQSSVDEENQDDEILAATSKKEKIHQEKKTAPQIDPEVKKWVSENEKEEKKTTENEIPISIPDFELSNKSKTANTSVTPNTPNPDEFALPSLDLLETPKPLMSHDSKSMRAKRQENAKILEETLASFNVEAKVVHITPGPSVTRYELQPGSGVKIAKITSLSRDIALKLAVPDIRMEAPIPGKALVGIEVPNTDVETVVIRHLIEHGEFFSHPSKLLCAMGLTITGESVFMDMAKMPHVLIAGATGSGKSVCINAIILSILLRATPDEVKFLMIDPKKVELSLYEGIPHLLAPVVTNPHKAAATLKQWALLEMERRYEEFSIVGVKDLVGYNKWVEKNPGHKKIPYIMVIIDELADLMMVAAQDVESTICRLAQMSRATGIHLVIATQRPSVNVITGLIKANVPSRISFFLQSQIDSRTILDTGGAEKLLGKGDMLYSPVGSFKPKRLQGIYVSEKEVKQVVNFIKAQGPPTYDEEISAITPEQLGIPGTKEDQDELYEAAKDIIQTNQYASTSYLQRKLRIGYNRAARLMDALKEDGLVPQNSEKRPPNA